MLRIHYTVSMYAWLYQKRPNFCRIWPRTKGVTTVSEYLKTQLPNVLTVRSIAEYNAEHGL